MEKFDVQERILVGTDLFVNFPRDIGLFYQACDVCLFPSRREALGYGALESMSSGVPVIGTSIQGLSEALGIVPGDSGGCPGGWAVVPEDSGALAAQLGAVLDEPMVLKRKGIEARRWVEKKFKLERMVSEHLSLFERIMAER